MLQNGALRALSLSAALWISATAAEAAPAEARAPAAPVAQPHLSRAILREQDLGPTVPQMSARVWSSLLRTQGETLRVDHRPSALAI